jgi:hypothetical protein
MASRSNAVVIPPGERLTVHSSLHKATLFAGRHVRKVKRIPVHCCLTRSRLCVVLADNALRGLLAYIAIYNTLLTLQTSDCLAH